ncbi:hypothetical protein HY383_01935 [Candidatus Daviesbacteria bacterium]|nr:hypothetical protein [Candidatus Daviesbacteria bacterium]
MKKSLLFTIIGVVFLLASNNVVIAETFCDKSDPNSCNSDSTLACLPAFKPPSQGGGPWFDESRNERFYTCQKVSPIVKIFGKIDAPAPLAGLLKNDPTGAGGISLFLSNLIALFFTTAMIVLVLMIIWGAFDWLISEGDKEKISGARKKIINAIIGIVLFAIAFAVIKVLGQFTGFTFFEGQNYTTQQIDTGIILKCSNGKSFYYRKTDFPTGYPKEDFSAKCKTT